MDVTYIKVFVDYLDAIEPLGDAERGRLFTALLEYARTGEAPQLGGNERFIFPMMRAQIDRDIAAMDEKSEKRSECGKLGGRPKKQTEAKKAKAFSESKKSKDKEKDEDKEKDKINPPISPQGADDVLDSVKTRFDLFWRAYPKKTGKGDAEKSWNRIKPGKDLFAQIMEALQKAVQCEQWLRDNGRFIPNPSTWLNQRRWEDEYVLPSQGSSYSYDDMGEGCPYG